MKAASPGAGAGGWEHGCGLGEDAPGIDAGSSSLRSPGRWDAGAGWPGGASGGCLLRAAREWGEMLGSAAESYVAFGKSLPFSLHEFCLL